MKYKFEYIYFILAFALLLVQSSCIQSNRDPGMEYMPEMQHSLAYETYAISNFDSVGLSAKQPVKGTIPRGVFPNDTVNTINYIYKNHSENNEEYYQSAGDRLQNPLKITDDVINEGKRLFGINCAICHGETGLGDGFIVKNEKFPAIPTSYYIERLMAMPMGQMYHVLEYGRNLMGSYSSQLNSEERWQVIAYIKFLQKEYASVNSIDSDNNETKGNNMEIVNESGDQKTAEQEK